MCPRAASMSETPKVGVTPPETLTSSTWPSPSPTPSMLVASSHQPYSFIT
jgi:hypothetical protein